MTRQKTGHVVSVEMTPGQGVAIVVTGPDGDITRVSMSAENARVLGDELFKAGAKAENE